MQTLRSVQQYIFRKGTCLLGMIYHWTIVCFALVVLSGCSSTESIDGTPTLHHHAQKGYNKSYQINGVWYHPQKHYEYAEEAHASYYGGRDVFHGRKTSTGEVFNMHGLSAAHKTLPLPCVVRVTNLENGRSLKLKVNDRGPFVDGRIIDVSMKAAKLLGFYQKGTARVRVETLVPESLHLAKSYKLRKSLPPSPKISQNSTLRVAQAEKTLVRPKEARPLVVNSHVLSASAPRSYIQLRAIKNEMAARNLAKNLAHKLRVPTKLMRRRHGTQASYHVFVGPFTSSNEAKILLKNVRSFGQQDATIINQ